MQCPFVEGIRKEMFDRLIYIERNAEVRCSEDAPSVIYWLLGKTIEDVEYSIMINIWRSAGESNNGMGSACI